MMTRKLVQEKVKSKNRYKQVKRRDATVQQQKQQILTLSNDVLHKKTKHELQKKKV